MSDIVPLCSNLKGVLMQDFVHLHVHTQYSLLDGQASVSRLVDKAMKDGMRGIAVTDHGNMFGIKEFTNYVNKKNSGPKGEIKDLKKKMADIESGKEECEDKEAALADCREKIAAAEAQEFKQNAEESNPGEYLIFFFAFAEFLHVQLRFLQFVYLLIDFLQLGIAGGTEIISVCCASYLSQSLFINLHRDLYILHSGISLHRIWCRSIGSNPNCVYTDTKLFGYFCSCQRRNISTVVDTIRQQNNNF